LAAKGSICGALGYLLPYPAANHNRPATSLSVTEVGQDTGAA